MNPLLVKCTVVLGAFFVFILSGNASLAQGKTEISTKTTINVGIYAPFSSKSAFIGRNMLGALEIARDQLKSSEINYEFYTLDVLPQNVKNSTAATLQKFIDMHHINVLITEGTKNGAIVAPLARKNNLVHFCLTTEEAMADGKNNFIAQNPKHNVTTRLNSNKSEFVKQFEQEYFSHPSSEAGYTFDTFQVLNHSVVNTLKTNSNYSTQAVTNNLLALQSGSGLMGNFSLDKTGISYAKKTLNA